VHYEDFVKGYWKPPVIKQEDLYILYASNCMAGEAGEVCDAVKKYIKGKYTKEDIILEMGDTLYYLTALAHELGVTLDDVIKYNRIKLDNRFSKKGAYGN
jgi:NTP pyrophosphatase (non-canonical NTP hydrolase)